MYICVHKNSLICLFTCTLSTGQTIPVLHLLLHLFPETIATIQPSHPTVAASRGTFLIWKGILESILGIALVTSDLLMTMLVLSSSLWSSAASSWSAFSWSCSRPWSYCERQPHRIATDTRHNETGCIDNVQQKPSDLLSSSWSQSSPPVPGNSHDLCFIHVPSDQVSMRLRLPALNLPVFHGLLVTSAPLPRLHPHQIGYCVLNMLSFFWLFLTCLFQYSIWFSTCSSRCWADYDVHPPFWLEVAVFPFIEYDVPHILADMAPHSSHRDAETLAESIRDPRK